MRRGVVGASGLMAVAALLAAGCGRSGAPTLDEGGGGGHDLHTPPFAVDMLPGDGSDGVLDLADDAVVVNTCGAIVSTGASSFDRASAAGLHVGGMVLLHQTTVDLEAGAGATAPVDAGNAGAWELGRVKSLAGVHVELEDVLTRSYLSNGIAFAQYCSVPQFSSVTLENSSIIAPAWGGQSGGILAMLVEGTLELDQDSLIDASRRGFRGGQKSASGTSSCSVSPGVVDEVVSDTTLAGGKGEGIDPSGWTLLGRGALGNAAGGGNSCLAGGGGGGNGGEGGAGGLEYGNGAPDSGDPNTFGRPGGAIVATSDPFALVFGGGGGAGHHDTSPTGLNAGEGGHGGGAVLVIAGALAGEGEIIASGEAGGDVASPNGDGAGGGGAGGTILVRAIRADAYDGKLTAGGGRGGEVDQLAVGPGGGGGGGFVFSPRAGIPTDVTGGSSGIDKCDSSSCNGSSNDTKNGAASGSAGLVVEP